MSNLRRHPRPGRSLAATVLAVLCLSSVALPAAAASDPARGQQWGLDVIRAEQAWSTGRGADVVIAIVDSGVDLRHEDLVDRLVPGIDIVDGDRTPQDGFGHGTHVAGTAAATGGNGRGIAGVAPDAHIMPVRVLDDGGSGSSADVVEGIRWAVDNGADVVNLSLGQRAQQVFGSTLVEAIRYAWSKGVVVVVAAGNEFVLSSGFTDEPAIVVSATTRDDDAPDYSNGVGGAKWGMAAPGGGCALLTCPREDDVFSTYWTSERPDTYAFLSGTSMAAPHVAGAAAILLGLGLSPQQTVDRLLATADDIGPSGRDSTFGSGRLDVAAAVAGLGSRSSGGTTDSGTSGRTTPTPRPPSPSPSPAASSAPSAPSPSPAATSAAPSPTATTPQTPATPSSDDGATTGGAPSPSTDGTPSTGPSTPITTPSAPSDGGVTPRTDDDAPSGGDLAASGEPSVDGAPPGWLAPLALVLLAAAAAAATGVALRRDDRG